jgi:hypothetical protein
LSAATYGGALQGASSEIQNIQNVTGRQPVCGCSLPPPPAIKLKDGNARQVF